MPRRTRRVGVTALLAGALTLAALPAVAAPAGPGWLVGLLDAVAVALRVPAAAFGLSEGETYPHLHPDGLTAPMPGPDPRGETYPELDPDGLRAASSTEGGSPQGDAFPELDPNGLNGGPPPSSSSHGEAFPHLDPDG